MTLALLPAVDILDGKCVRLVRGDYAQSTVFDDDPVHAACRWQEEGATWLHVVDLDGAKAGEPQNLDHIFAMVRTTALFMEASGGIRTLDQVARLLDAGVARIVLGTAAVEQPGVVEVACARWGDAIALGLDARHGLVAVRGWVATTTVPAVDLAERMVASGIRRIVSTDIERDGTLTTPNFTALKELVDRSGVPIIASGGVSTIEHLLHLQALGLEGAVVGRALYDGRLNFRAALHALSQGGVVC